MLKVQVQVVNSTLCRFCLVKINNEILFVGNGVTKILLLPSHRYICVDLGEGGKVKQGDRGKPRSVNKEPCTQAGWAWGLFSEV